MCYKTGRRDDSKNKAPNQTLAHAFDDAEVYREIYERSEPCDLERLQQLFSFPINRIGETQARTRGLASQAKSLTFLSQLFL